MGSEPLAIIQNVTKTFDKKRAIHDVSSELYAGEILGLVGPDGAGKTTLIRLLAGLLKPDSGSITVKGFDTIQQPENLHEIIGYMPQRFGLYEDLSVIQNLELYASLRLVPQSERQERFDTLLNFTGLKPFLSRLAGNLSGGMKQKLGLACAMVKKPSLLLLDEPSVGVDPLSRRELWKMVRDLIDEGVSVVWSTSYLEEAGYCDKTILLNEGEVLFQGEPATLIQRVNGRVFQISGDISNKREVLQSLFEQENVLDGVIQGSRLRVVVKEKKEPLVDLSRLSGGTSLIIKPYPPCFEDAFIDIMGVKTGKKSLLAEKTPQVAETDMPTVTAEHLTKKFGQFTAAKDVSFKIKRGEIFGLLGPNGAGKSTTFKMLCGLLKPTEGQGFVNGLNLETASGQARSHLGYMAQKFSLYGNLSVMQNLDYFAGIYNLSGLTKKSRIDEMIQIFDLQTYLDSTAESLSLGFKQRLALACALMHSPNVLFLDEPTSGVDPITRREFWNHINGLVHKGVTVLITTHFMDEAEYCDRIALLYKSQVIREGTPEDLKNAVKKNEENITLEEAFINMIQEYDKEHQNA